VTLSARSGPAESSFRDPEARLLRRAAGPAGLCATCAMAQFIQHLRRPKPCGAYCPGGNPRAAMPAVPYGFAPVLAAGPADAEPAEINWQRVVNC
jgi:hypothetical protein